MVVEESSWAHEIHCVEAGCLLLQKKAREAMSNAVTVRQRNTGRNGSGGGVYRLCSNGDYGQ
jgi:hypothetical protein